MADRGAHSHCQLYVIMEVHAATRDHLTGLLALGPIASILFQPAPGTRLSAQSVKPLVDLAQGKGSAALLRDDVALARALRADGVHLSAALDNLARYEDARSVLGARAIVGADAGGSRHMAMELGEAGAEYVAFGQTTLPRAADPAAEEDASEPREAFTQVELINWWSEVFEVPCVALDVTGTDRARDMAAAGADFVAVTCPIATSPADVVTWFTDFKRSVERVHA
jgi:thiamine-phosphate pyrophosphorylase